MSKRHIVVSIDANAKTCGLCDWARHGMVSDYCRLLGDWCDESKRLEECLVAEKVYKEATHGKA